MEGNISTSIPTKNNPIKIDHYLMTKLLGKGSSSIVKCKQIFSLNEHKIIFESKL